MKRIAYLISGDCNVYTISANAYQKVVLAVEHLHADLLVPKGYRDFVPKAFSQYGNIREISSIRDYRNYDLLLHSVSNEATMLHAIMVSLFAPVVLFCWDPPGVVRRDEKSFKSKMRCWLMDRLLSISIRRSKGLILNLHPEFSNRFAPVVRNKIHHFPNGTNIAYNQSCCVGVSHLSRRIAVSGTFSASKGCWLTAKLFVKLWQDNHTTSLAWTGYGDQLDAVKQYFIRHGIPATSFVLGPKKHDAALQLMSTGSVALCLYQDVPSLRWNYILKAPEFFSLGIPVAASNLPGVKEYVIDGQTGWLCNPNDEDACFVVVKKALDDGETLEAMRRSAFEKARQYDWKMINQEIARTISAIGGVS